MLRLLNLSALFLCILTAPLHANDVRTLAESLESKAVHGDLKSAYKLGLLWSQGKKIAADYHTAAEWFERAAQGGYPQAMIKIAQMYALGQGVEKSPDTALSWYEKAAQKDSRAAMTQLGAIYALTNDFEKSANWYAQSAVKGDSDAMRELGIYYLNGTGVQFDLTLAFAWLELAAKKGDAQAKSLQKEILQSKGQEWGDTLRRQIDNRMVPESYWNAR
ncbi:tetratricopeptide repeat protein [Terasakiella pusilla]|uniref:tetratricopeptide repeat protein n=1 Tax=Terasakiella pusilla TaxID=64973 RepID=UPI003AA9444F